MAYLENPATAPLDMNLYRILNLSDGVAPLDGVNLSQLEAALAVHTDTMEGIRDEATTARDDVLTYQTATHIDAANAAASANLANNHQLAADGFAVEAQNAKTASENFAAAAAVSESNTQNYFINFTDKWLGSFDGDFMPDPNLYSVDTLAFNLTTGFMNFVWYIDDNNPGLGLEWREWVARGVQGLPGDTGPQGPQGIQGDVGPQGIQGVPGPQGIQGVEGPAGPQGTIGPVGPEGPAGPQGPVGPQGPAGPTGPQGVKGAKGDKGDNGTGIYMQGYATVAFINALLPSNIVTGTGYTMADTGTITVGGSAPLAVTAEDLVVWQEDDSFINYGPLAGVEGPQGPAGPQGPIGPQGPTGPQGDTGPQGIQGEKGDKGDTGDTGPQGIQGVQGVQGPSGVVTASDGITNSGTSTSAVLSVDSTVVRTTGTYGISITGNAATATKLATARSINGTSFDGSTNITTATWGTPRLITIGNTTRSVDGSLNLSWTVADLGVMAGYSVLTNANQTAPSGVRYDPNANNPTNEHYAGLTYGNNGNVTGQLFSHYVTGESYVRGFNTAWSSWRKLLDSTNFTGFTVTKTGAGASGTWGISISGNAATATSATTATTATTLTTSRTINGTSFNGSANITTANWGTARTLTIGATGKSVNGSGNVSWSLAEIGALGATAQAADSAKLVGYSLTAAATANTVARRDGHGDLSARLMRSTFANQTTISGALAFRVNNSYDNYTRFCSDTGAIKTWLGAANSVSTSAAFGGFKHTFSGGVLNLITT